MFLCVLGAGGRKRKTGAVCKEGGTKNNAVIQGRVACDSLTFKLSDAIICDGLQISSFCLSKLFVFVSFFTVRFLYLIVVLKKS